MDLISFNNHLQVIKNIINFDLIPYTQDLSNNSTTLEQLTSSNQALLDLLDQFINELENGSVVGEKGDKGDQGIQGEKGDKGDQGIQGEKGDNGLNGLNSIYSNYITKNVITPLTSNKTSGTFITDLDYILEPNSIYEFEVYFVYSSTVTTNGATFYFYYPQSWTIYGTTDLSVTGTSTARMGSQFPNQNYHDLGGYVITGTSVQAVGKYQTAVFKGTVFTSSETNKKFDFKFSSETTSGTITLDTKTMLILKKVNSQ